MNSTEIPHDVKKLKVDLSLEGMKKFVSTTIPEIKVYQDGIPTETRQLYLILEDLDFHSFPHGVKLIPYEGIDLVLQESLKIAPLSPLNGSHQYRLTVRALDQEDRIIGIGLATQQFP